MRPRGRQATGHLEAGFSFNGGIGDCLIQAEYVRHFVARFSDVSMRITAFAMTSHLGATAADLFRGATFIDEARPRLHGQSYRSIKRFDVFIQMDRFPQLIGAHLPSIESRAAALARYLGQLLEFQQKHRFIVTNSPRSDMLANQLCQLNGKTRYTGPDILGALGMKDDAGKFMELDPVGISLVERLGLFERPYVTIQRGVDHNNHTGHNVRLWPVDKYNELVKRLKESHPDLQIVQMGYSTELCDPIEGVDLDLAGC